MDATTVTIIVAVMALSGTALTAFLASRGQSKQTEVTAEGTVISGYDKLVAALQGEVDRLTARVTELETRVTNQASEIERLRAELQSGLCDDCPLEGEQRRANGGK